MRVDDEDDDDDDDDPSGSAGMLAEVRVALVSATVVATTFCSPGVDYFRRFATLDEQPEPTDCLDSLVFESRRSHGKRHGAAIRSAGGVCRTDLSTNATAGKLATKHHLLAMRSSFPSNASRTTDSASPPPAFTLLLLLFLLL